MVGTTPGGKVLQRVRVSGSNLFKVEFTTGGELPPELQTMWTSTNDVQRDVDRYLKRLAQTEENSRVYLRNRQLKRYREDQKLKKFKKLIEDAINSSGKKQL